MTAQSRTQSDGDEGDQMPITDEDARRIAQAQTDENANNGCMGCFVFLLVIPVTAAVSIVFFPFGLLSLPLAYFSIRGMNRSLRNLNRGD